MKIVRADKIDSVSDYQLLEVERPSPGAAQALIEVHACGMGYVDALVALGRYQVKPPTPFIPGQEIAGMVVDVGPGVTHLKPGDRVFATAFGGGLAGYVALDAAGVQAIPNAMSYAQAASLSINYLTAMHGLVDRAALSQGQRLLVFGSAGGVGAAAVQIGGLLGADVIAAASTEEKRQFARQIGAQATIDATADGWRDRLRLAAGGKGPDVVFDPVTGPLMEAAFRSLTWGGRYLVVGFASGQIGKLPVNLPLMKGAALIGVDVRQFLTLERAQAARHMARLLSWCASGALVIPHGKTFALEDYAAAMDFALSGAGIGKVIIEMRPG